MPEPPIGVEVVGNSLLIWQKPGTPNGVIVGYDMSITFTPSNNPIARSLGDTTFYYVFREDDFPANTVMAQVRVCMYHFVLH